MSVQGLVTVAHLAGLREGVVTATGDQHGRSQNEKPDPSISGDHVGQISLSNPDQNNVADDGSKRACAFAVGVILR